MSLAFIVDEHICDTQQRATVNIFLLSSSPSSRTILSLLLSMPVDCWCRAVQVKHLMLSLDITSHRRPTGKLHHFESRYAWATCASFSQWIKEKEIPIDCDTMFTLAQSSNSPSEEGWACFSSKWNHFLPPLLLLLLIYESQCIFIEKKNKRKKGFPYPFCRNQGERGRGRESRRNVE